MIEIPILITGGTGFVGSHLVEALLSAGYSNIHVTTYKAADAYTASLLPADHIHPVDLTQSEPTLTLIQELKPAHVYHLAAFATVGKSFDSAQKTLHNNMILQLNVLEAVKQAAPQARVLVIGSGMEYDFVQMAHHGQEKANEYSPLGPISPYAISKVVQDLLGLSYFYSYQMNVLRVRPFNHIGERQSPDFAIASFAQQIVKIERGEQANLSVGNLDAVRDFTDVKDMVKAYVLLMEKGVVGEVYNIGSGEGYTMKQVLDMLCELAQTPIQVETDAMRIRPLDIPTAVTDNDKITQLGWSPTIPLSDTLIRILNYWRTQS